jgi:predicted nuclease of restriction endonuclease-like (RecB) superfamily
MGMNGLVNPLYNNIRELLISCRQTAVRSVNTLHVLTNFEIGRLIVEHEQQGVEGKQTLKELSKRLTSEFGRGFSKSNLEYMRRFYLEYCDRVFKIAQISSGQSFLKWKNKKATSSKMLNSSFSLSWSQYIFLMGIENVDERQFYEIEAEQNDWTLPEIKRQYNTGERLAVSRDKEKIKELSDRGQLVEKPEDILKNPYVLEFLGLDEKSAYSENDLETAIIDKIEHFLLELGKGFLFEARQKRFTFDEDHFFVDLVFYNRMLRCYVLIDLKIGIFCFANRKAMRW